MKPLTPFMFLYWKKTIKMDNKENNSPLSGENRYSVALVFTRQTQIGSIETMLRNLVCYAKSEKEALGDAIQYFEEESKGFGLICKCVIQIDEQSRIAELEAENAKLREALERIQCIKPFANNISPNIHYERGYDSALFDCKIIVNEVIKQRTDDNINP